MKRVVTELALRLQVLFLPHEKRTPQLGIVIAPSPLCFAADILLWTSVHPSFPEA